MDFKVSKESRMGGTTMYFVYPQNEKAREWAIAQQGKLWYPLWYGAVIRNEDYIGKFVADGKQAGFSFEGDLPS